MSAQLLQCTYQGNGHVGYSRHLSNGGKVAKRHSARTMLYEGMLGPRGVFSQQKLKFSQGSSHLPISDAKRSEPPGKN